MATLVPYQVQNLNAEQADGNIQLTWTGSLGSTGYIVQRSTDGVNFTTIATLGLVASYQDTLPGIATMFYYQVAGITAAGSAATATLTFNGQPNSSDTVMIANVTFIAGTNFSIGSNVAATIINLTNAINSTISLKYIVVASYINNIITITSVQNGSIGNGLEFVNSLTNVVGLGFSNGVNPVQGPFSSQAQMVAAPPSEMSLYELRLRSQQTADRVNGNFVTTTEWNAFLRLAMYELYDLLITAYEDYFAQSYVFINTNGTIQNYPVPDGVTNYLGGVYPNGTGSPAPAFYKMAGMDLGINTSNNAWVTLLKFDFIERNKYVYPNSTSTIYGVYNMRYRLMGNNINFIPTPAGNQQVRLWYSPKLRALLADTDCTTIGFSGWLRYVIARAAKYALDKEEGTDTGKLDQEIAFLKTRIEQAASNRDAGVPDTISETQQNPNYNSGWGSGGGNAGW